ncbi:MAG TPA: PLP-dependent aspartate aminotransferase family protein [Methylotenera sp.]|nr:PLP-dependent aspartate aminotransferase family protein [Methylotenera sp.]
MDKMSAGFSTRCIHAGELNDQYGSLHTPLYDTSTFGFNSTEQMLDVIEGRKFGFLYTRYGSNPSIKNVETKLASIELAEESLVFSSGMAAISSTLLAHGARGVICFGEVYGGSWELMFRQLKELGRSVVFLDSEDWQGLNQQLSQGLGLVYFETPSNPLLNIIDIAKVCKIAHEFDAIVAIDSTFATPVNQQTIKLGADIVIHSATKYLGGHSDLTGGVVAGSHMMLAPLRIWRKNLGQCMSPEAAHLLARSLSTLEIRVKQQNTSALRIAEILQNHPAIEKVNYPGLVNFSGYSVARRQMSGFGGMLSIAIRGGAAAAIQMVDALRLFAIAPSLGGSESLVSQPSLTSHRDLSVELRAERGIEENLVRLSIGLENPEDIENDLLQALLQLI